MQYISAVAEERETNGDVRNGISEDVIVAMRQARAAPLEMPTPIPPAAQFNMRAGQLTTAVSCGQPS